MGSLSTDRLLLSATERHRAGDLVAARRLYAQALAEDPTLTVARFRSGLLEMQEGQLNEALALMAQACAEAAEDARYQFGLAQVLQALGRWREAADAYRRALNSEPASFDAWFALAVALQQDGQLADAAAAYGEALALRPDDAASLGNLGCVCRELGDIDRAIHLLRTAIAREPGVASHAVNLGIALCQRREFAAAELLLREVLAAEPNNAEASFNLGNALRGLHRLREALQQFRHAVAVRPNYAHALNNLGNVHKELGELAEARSAFAAALQAKPDYVLALNNLGCLLRTLGQSAAAEDALRRGLEIDPQHAALYDNLGNVLKDAGELDEAILCFRKALALDSTNAGTHSNLAYALSFQSLEAQPILDECLRWNERFAAPLLPRVVAPLHDSSPDRRLKIGYVSADFREHCQSLFTTPLLSQHDHASFEVFCYSSVVRPDDCTRRLAAYADVWRDVHALDDAALSEIIRADRIDVLVDLTMHMANGRPLVFARKPAPVQIAWLAYPGTTGIRAIDHRLSDPRLDPDGFENHYSERTLRLADSFWCYDPLTAEPGVNALPAAESGYLTLGCLNSPCKLTDQTLRLWGGVMNAMPRARLLLLAPPGRHRERLLQRLEAHRIASHRVRFVEFRPRAQYLRTYHDIDIGLDTFPYNGHTTSLDSLWMGVPIVTRVGHTCVGRGGVSQLYHLDLLDLAAESDEGFVDAVVALGSDLERLAALRQNLRARLERSPLMDGHRFARNVERAYRQAWRDQCARR
jgi:protein O-GlcNAc transferase